MQEEQEDDVLEKENEYQEVTDKNYWKTTTVEIWKIRKATEDIL